MTLDLLLQMGDKVPVAWVFSPTLCVLGIFLLSVFTGTQGCVGTTYVSTPWQL